MKVFIVLVLISISCANAGLTDHSSKYEHCSVEHKVPEYKDKFNQLTAADEDKAKCFVNCVYKEVFPKRIHEDGSLDVDEMIGFAPKEHVDEARECFKFKDDADHCKTTFKQHVCFYGFH